MKVKEVISLFGIACLATSTSIMATESPPGAPASLAVALSLGPHGGSGTHSAWESMTTWSGGYEAGAAILGYDIGWLLTA